MDVLRAWSTNAIEEVIEFRGETTLVVPRKVLRAVAERCRDDNALRFNLLTDATCVDRYPMEPRYELQYHLVSIAKKNKVRLRVKLSGDDPVVDSLVPVWLALARPTAALGAGPNIANGADGSCVQQTLGAVDALIGNLVIPPVGNGHLPLTPYVRMLGLYNAGGLCAPRCDLPPSPPPSPGPTARPHPTQPPRP